MKNEQSENKSISHNPKWGVEWLADGEKQSHRSSHSFSTMLAKISKLIHHY